MLPQQTTYPYREESNQGIQIVPGQAAPPYYLEGVGQMGPQVFSQAQNRGPGYQIKNNQGPMYSHPMLRVPNPEYQPQIFEAPHAGLNIGSVSTTNRTFDIKRKCLQHIYNEIEVCPRDILRHSHWAKFRIFGGTLVCIGILGYALYFFMKSGRSVNQNQMPIYLLLFWILLGAVAITLDNKAALANTRRHVLNELLDKATAEDISEMLVFVEKNKNIKRGAGSLNVLPLLIAAESRGIKTNFEFTSK